MAWILLMIAGTEEVISVSLLKYVHEYRKKWPVFIIVLGYALSFTCMAIAMKSITPGVAYAVWTGMGSVGITLVSYFWFKEKIYLPQVICLSLIVIGIAGLKLN
ncbi:QacE family quaternary ammonium compound efflux SMR transporter [Virgibacillus phasianinus]|uniref:QacE family quaternary ammonium compound efflux SMR transporter n=1 Tax=Virgibacillus phasianinus TaxID=2017483 RepID=A0A220U1Y6_9BACI|nr:multidrug efflux SMR transporter [Virgibacillus phasianinus]ASK61936.1 QacE family quaternary ammonium compound efflux SMR transporter [Virgibacillus phasianinus]